MEGDYHRIPIIGFWDLLLVPLQGDMTDDMAAQLVSEVLERIHRSGSSGLMIDITGLWLVDSHLCSVLSQLAAAASLMGARTIISGMKPEIAMALETMGIRLENVTTTLDLETALGILGVGRPDLAAGPLESTPPPDEKPALAPRVRVAEGLE
ncbi:MAG TPA: STAS domain-containing protein [Polyangiaceae bacterium]|nr:STAS domain-containing protein [Polyangiaceae bacterium]